MAMAANPPLSPSAVAASSADNVDGSPQARRRTLSSPWAQVVRGVESESVPSPPSPSPEQTPFTICSVTDNTPPEALPESSDTSDGNAGRTKKPAWKKPSNGVVEPSSVMGGSVSWPALSESTRPTTKSSSDPSKPASDGSVSSSQGPIISQTPQKQVNTNSNHGIHRQRSMKHRGGGGSGSGPGGGSAQGGYNRPPPPPPPPLPPSFPGIEMPPYGNYGNFMPPPVLDSSARGPRPMGGVGPQSGNDHSSHAQRNSSRRNSFGSRPRGDGQYHNNHGDMASPFMYVPTLPPEPFRGMPLIAQGPPPPVFFSVIDPSLPALIVKQIDYYFSDANLIKDDYLRSNMDDQGWVPISLIASFPRGHSFTSKCTLKGKETLIPYIDSLFIACCYRNGNVQQLTADVQLILDSLRGSVVVEVKEQGDKIRRRNEWQKWVHSGGKVSPDLGSQAPGTSSDDNNLPTSIEKLSLDDDNSSKMVSTDKVDSETEVVADRHLPEESSFNPVLDNGELTAEELLHSSQ
ncbi:hypothetical protein M9H77_00183 [Catharanthus roseus]|nr:hypothetical protein M9H77_00183 [Catharanthus roseus]